MLVADDKAMPKAWGKVNSKNAPTTSLMITGVLQTIFLFSLLFTEKAYEFAYSLCAAAILFSYLFVGLYQMKLSSERKEWGQYTVGLLSALFMFACMFLAGWQEVLLVTISFIPGFCVYYAGCKENNHKFSKAELWTMGLILVLSVVAVVLVCNGTITIS